MRFIFLFLILTISGVISAQEVLSDDLEISVEAGDYLHRLQQIAENPFDLNRVSERRLLEIPFINRSLARSIIARRKNAPFKSVDELKLLEGVTPDLFQAMQPYFKVHSEPSPFSIKVEQRGVAFAHKTRGYLNGAYGNRIAIRQRYFVNWNDQVRLLVQSEKDAGEQNWLDHISGSLQLQNAKNTATLLLGDYYAVFGYGLVSAGAYGSRLAVGGGTASLNPPVFRIRRKSGSDETAFLRGGACLIEPMSDIQILLAISQKSLDGVLTDDSSAVKRLDNTGLHRTDTEESRRNIQSEVLLQGGVAVGLGEISGGFFWQRNEYQKPLQVLEGRYSGGDRFSVLLKYRGASVISALETAATSKGIATVGAIVLRTGRLQYGVNVFQYSNGYFAPHGRQIGSFSDLPSNRRGTELLSNLKLPGRLKLSFRAGTFSPVEAEEDFPGVTKRLDILLLKESKKAKFTFRYSSRSPGGNVLFREGLEIRRRLRVEWQYLPGKFLQFRQRIEYSRHAGRLFGVSFMQDLRYQFNRSNRIQFRYTHFDIPDFDLRQYEVESGLPGELESRLLNGRGYKWFLLVHFAPVKQLQFAIKYRAEYYPDLETLGSGNDLVLGNARRYLRAYVRLKL